MAAGADAHADAALRADRCGHVPRRRRPDRLAGRTRASVGDPRIVWSESLDGGIGGRNMPLVWDGVVFVAHERGGIDARRLADGRPVWTADIGAPIDGTGVITAGLLIVPSDRWDRPSLRARRTARSAWSTSGRRARPEAPLAVVGDLVLAGADDGWVRALDVRSGSERWSLRAGGPIQRAPTIDGDTGWVGTADGRLVAFATCDWCGAMEEGPRRRSDRYAGPQRRRPLPGAGRRRRWAVRCGSGPWTR